MRGGVEEGCVSPSPGKSRDVSRKTKQEPDLHSAFPPLQGGKLKVEPGEGDVVGPGLADESHGGLSPTREMLPPASHHYGLGKEEVLGQLGMKLLEFGQLCMMLEVIVELWQLDMK